MSMSMAFPSLNDGDQLAVLEHEGVTLLALGSGCCVAIAIGEVGEVTQLLGPHAHTVSCIDWLRSGSDVTLAVGAGREVTFYKNAHDQWVRWRTISHDAAVHALRWAGQKLWTVSGQKVTLWTCASDDWMPSWSCNVSLPVLLLAPSADGALLATSGRCDRLVKVWHHTQVRHIILQQQSFSLTFPCSYLVAIGRICLQLPPSSTWAAVSRVETTSRAGACFAPPQ